MVTLLLSLLVNHLISLPKKTYWAVIGSCIVSIFYGVSSKLFTSKWVRNVMDLSDASNLFRDPSVHKFILFFVLFCQCINFYLELIAH